MLKDKVINLIQSLKYTGLFVNVECLDDFAAEPRLYEPG